VEGGRGRLGEGERRGEGSEEELRGVGGGGRRRRGGKVGGGVQNGRVAQAWVHS